MSIGFATKQRDMLTNKYCYAPEYFSGCDVHMYINGICVDEAMRLSFELQERCAPIYGYASVTYDALAQGTKIVQGWFDIAFRRVGYLYYILDDILGHRDITEAPRHSTLQATPISKEIKLPGPVRFMDSPSFDKWAQSYEEAIWGKELAREDVIDQDGAYGLEVTHTYGSEVGGRIKGHLAHNHTSFVTSGFDILITYGEFNGVASLADDVAVNYSHFTESSGGTRPNFAQAPYTINTINEVALIGLSKMIEPSGGPIMERYAFIAKDINRPIARADGRPSGGGGSRVSGYSSTTQSE